MPAEADPLAIGLALGLWPLAILAGLGFARRLRLFLKELQDDAQWQPRD